MSDSAEQNTIKLPPSPDPAVSVEHEPPESKIAALAEVKDLYAAGLQVGIEMGRRLGNGGSGGFTTNAAGHNVVAGDAPEFGHVGDTPEDDAIADVLNALTEVADGDGDIDELRETCAAALNSLKTLVRFIDAVRAASPRMRDEEKEDQDHGGTSLTEVDAVSGLVPTPELSHDESSIELLVALKAVVAVADRQTYEFDSARRAIANAEMREAASHARKKLRLLLDKVALSHKPHKGAT